MTNDSAGSAKTAQARKNSAMMHKFSEYFAVIAVKQFSPLVSYLCMHVYLFIYECVCALLIKARRKTTLGMKRMEVAMAMSCSANGDVCANFIGTA